MSETILDDLPYVKASTDFEMRLYGEALSECPHDQPTAFTLSSTPSIWASFAMAASLVLGLGFGLGGAAFVEDALLGLGLGDTVTYAELDDVQSFDIYSDFEMQLSL